MNAAIAPELEVVRFNRYNWFKHRPSSVTKSQGYQYLPDKWLTKSELEVAKSVASGLFNKEHSATYGISIKTVEKHRQQVMNKLGIDAAVLLAHWALHRGLVRNVFEREDVQQGGLGI